MIILLIFQINKILQGVAIQNFKILYKLTHFKIKIKFKTKIKPNNKIFFHKNKTNNPINNSNKNNNNFYITKKF